MSHINPTGLHQPVSILNSDGAWYPERKKGGKIIYFIKAVLSNAHFMCREKCAKSPMSPKITVSLRGDENDEVMKSSWLTATANVQFLQV